jgi:hypothetical protein
MASKVRNNIEISKLENGTKKKKKRISHTTHTLFLRSKQDEHFFFMMLCDAKSTCMVGQVTRKQLECHHASYKLAGYINSYS